MTIQNIEEIIKLRLGNDIYNFNFGELIRKPGAKGCIKIEDNWFLYDEQDERLNITYTGPFDEKALIFAISKIYNRSSLFSEYKFTNEEYKIFLHNHFSSIEEVKEKYPELK